MDLEDFEQLQFPAELAPHITDDRHRPVAQGHAVGAAAQDEVHAPEIGQGEVAAVGDVQVEVEVERPDAHAHDGGGQAFDRLAPRTTKQHEQHAEPEIHEYTDD
ncbi:hypothetical protein C4K28_2336 [Pseudomonas chlororaphis subsp. piscium]|nr:hypothetical protein C4K28_2336 [Pseudomonas chlororaphis subsp. piscium]